MRGIQRYGLCECGCGQPTEISRSSNRRFGYVKGKHRRFVLGHSTRRSPVDYVADEAGCWVWQLDSRRGYGSKRVGGRNVPAHRWYYEQAFGPIPADMQIHHECENTLCVNPAHLQALPYRTHITHHRKLKHADVRAIRGSTDSQQEVAERFGISQSLVSLVKSRKVWADV